MFITINCVIKYINPFLANTPILYPLKTQENLWLSIVSTGYKMGKLARRLN